MEKLWGEFLPVPENQLKIPKNGEEIVIGNLHFIPIDTPGHAEHHYSYLFEDTCFTGDIGGVRIPGFQYLRVPMPPPELHFGKWRDSISRLKKEKFKKIAPTHFGIFDDPKWQLDTVEKNLDEAERWLEGIMSSRPDIEELRHRFKDWMNKQGLEQGLTADVARAYELANPPGMSADGLMRYWNKYRYS